MTATIPDCYKFWTEDVWQHHLKIVQRNYPEIWESPTKALEESIHSIFDAIELFPYQAASMSDVQKFRVSMQLNDAADYLDLLMAVWMLRQKRKRIRGRGGIAV